jgi:hypothetical protein
MFSMNNFKAAMFIAALLVSGYIFCQSNFPNSWSGHWKGELTWYKTGTDPQKVNMELIINPTDSAHTFTWQIIYGSVSKDNRPYTLIAKDTAKGHWVIDENNGIVLDQFWVANKFCGVFSVQNATIMNNYYLENDMLFVEFYSYASKPINTSGKGTNEIPFADSYKINSYQKAVLHRSK